MTAPAEPREPMKLCGRRFAVCKPDDEEPDYVYCGLQHAHSGWHVAMVWFWDNDVTAQEGWPPRD